METIISRQVKFPQLGPEDKIDTTAMLEAATGLTFIIDRMGKQFSHSKDDILGNIAKIKKVYDTAPEKFAVFNTMLEVEKEAGKHKADSSATVAGLWLKRGLEFTCEFFWEIIQEYEACEKPYPQKDTCYRDLIKAAYNKTLTNHHNMAARLVFKGAAYLCPYKDKFLQDLALGNPGQDDKVIADMKEYEAPLRDFCINMGNLFLQYGDKGPVVQSAKATS